MLATLADDIGRTYDERPIVVVHDDHQEGEVVEILKHGQWRYTRGANEEVMATIRHWSYGVLLLRSSHSRGIDTRF